MSSGRRSSRRSAGFRPGLGDDRLCNSGRVTRRCKSSPATCSATSGIPGSGAKSPPGPRRRPREFPKSPHQSGRRRRKVAESVKAPPNGRAKIALTTADITGQTRCDHFWVSPTRPHHPTRLNGRRPRETRGLRRPQQPASSSAGRHPSGAAICPRSRAGRLRALSIEKAGRNRRAAVWPLLRRTARGRGVVGGLIGGGLGIRLEELHVSSLPGNGFH